MDNDGLIYIMYNVIYLEYLVLDFKCYNRDFIGNLYLLSFSNLIIIGISNYLRVDLRFCVYEEIKFVIVI